MNLKGIGVEYRKKLGLVIAVAKNIITPKIVAETLSVSRQEAARILSRWDKSGWVKRIKQGVYTPVSIDDPTGELATGDSWILAERLYSPGYIGGFSAVKHWDFSEQIFETTTYLTTKKVKNRSPTFGNIRFHLKTITDKKFFGTKSVWHDNIKIAVSDPSKTVVDLLDDPALVGGMRIVQDVFLEYLESKYFDFTVLHSYAKQIGNKTTIKRLGYMLEHLGRHDLINSFSLLDDLSSGYSLFDPTTPNDAIVRRWNLKVPKSWSLSK